MSHGRWSESSESTIAAWLGDVPLSRLPTYLAPIAEEWERSPGGTVFGGPAGLPGSGSEPRESATAPGSAPAAPAPAAAVVAEAAGEEKTFADAGGRSLGLAPPGRLHHAATMGGLPPMMAAPARASITVGRVEVVSCRIQSSAVTDAELRDTLARQRSASRAVVATPEIVAVAEAAVAVVPPAAESWPLAERLEGMIAQLRRTYPAGRPQPRIESAFDTSSPRPPPRA